jgi:ABC-2 type transport system permease protein
MTHVPLRHKIRIILSITGKDIQDAIKNKTTISVLISALFLFFFYLFFPILEQEDTINLYAAGNSEWLPALEDSKPYKINIFNTQEAMEYQLQRRGEPHLGLVLTEGFDPMVAAGGPVQMAGFLLNWVSQKEASRLIGEAETQISGVVGAPVNVSVERLTMLPETTGIGLSRGLGGLLLIIMIGMLLVPHLMLEEKRTRTLDALLISPATAGQITMGKALTGLFYCLLGCAMVWLFNLAMITQWWLAILAGVLIALFSVALGLFMGVFVANRQQLLVMANFTIFPLILVIFLSIEIKLIPAWLGMISSWLPTSIAFDLFRLSFTPYHDFSMITPRLAVLLIFILIFMGLTAWKIKRSDRM